MADLEEKLPGRGLWLTPSTDIVERACAENVFPKAAQRNVTVPSNLSEKLVSLLGQAVHEFDSSRASIWLRSGRF